MVVAARAERESEFLKKFKVKFFFFFFSATSSTKERRKHGDVGAAFAFALLLPSKSHLMLAPRTPESAGLA